MTSDESARQAAQARRRAAADEYDCTAGILPVLAAMFPVPNMDGMSPAEAETVLTKWRAEVAAHEAQMQAESDAWWAAKSAQVAAS